MHHLTGRVVGMVLSGALLIGSLGSCGSSTRAAGEGVPASGAISWVKVRQSPPTYFPKGVPADHPTGFTDGMWIETGHETGSRYFIPARGANTQELISDALAKVTPERREEIRKSGGGADLKGTTTKVLQGGARGLGDIFLFWKREQARAHYSGQ